MGGDDGYGFASAAALFNGSEGGLYHGTELEGEGFFFKNILRPLLRRFDDLSGGWKPCCKNDQGAWVRRTDARKEGQPIERLDGEIRDHEIDLGGIADLSSLLCMITAEDAEVIGGKVFGRPFQVVEIGIDQKNSLFCRGV